MEYKILTINPGSTSTKVGYFKGEEKLFSVNVKHQAEELAQFENICDQLPYRKGMILAALNDAGIDIHEMDAFVGRGGGLVAVEGGTYIVNDTLLAHARAGANGVRHPAQLGSLIASELAKEADKPAFVVNPPDTDELCRYARLTGVKGIYRNVHLHALNLKETAIRHSAKNGVRYEDKNYIVCHIGGGISISAHCKGRMIDGNDIVGGEGPMAPTRCGSLPVSEVIRYCFSGVDEKKAMELCTKTGGFLSLLGTADALDVSNRAQAGEEKYLTAWNAMIYQISKFIGSMACVLEGKVDGILLGGAMAYDDDLVKKLKASCEWIAPIFVYPGEFELEAMAQGAIRVLSGSENAKVYDGTPAWSAEDIFD